MMAPRISLCISLCIRTHFAEVEKLIVSARMPIYRDVVVAIAALHSNIADAYVVGGTTAQATRSAGRFTAPVQMVALDDGRTGSSYLSEETLERARAGNPIEKVKIAKDGTSAFTDVYEYAAAIRAGTLNWEDVEKADMDSRLKWVGLLHRSKRTPGRFMMRLRTPNGIVSSAQLRFYADSVEKYGPEIGVVDITTRQNIQLRGVALEDADTIIDGLHALNQTSFQSALDNVRNLVGSPLAGIDPLGAQTRLDCQRALVADC